MRDSADCALSENAGFHSPLGKEMKFQSTSWLSSQSAADISSVVIRMKGGSFGRHMSNRRIGAQWRINCSQSRRCLIERTDFQPSSSFTTLVRFPFDSAPPDQF
jgi:hypothetical protein